MPNDNLLIDPKSSVAYRTALASIKLLREASVIDLTEDDQPLFYIALVAMIVGVQLFVGGFLGELISRNSPDRNQYQIDQRIGGV